MKLIETAAEVKKVHIYMYIMYMHVHRAWNFRKTSDTCLPSSLRMII